MEQLDKEYIFLICGYLDFKSQCHLAFCCKTVMSKMEYKSVLWHNVQRKIKSKPMSYLVWKLGKMKKKSIGCWEFISEYIYWNALNNKSMRPNLIRSYATSCMNLGMTSRAVIVLSGRHILSDAFHDVTEIEDCCKFVDRGCALFLKFNEHSVRTNRLISNILSGNMPSAKYLRNKIEKDIGCDLQYASWSIC